MPEEMNNRDFIEWLRTTDDTTAINPDHIRKLRELAGISFNVRWDIMCDLASLRVTVREQETTIDALRVNISNLQSAGDELANNTEATIRQQAEEIQRLTEKRETADEKENGFRFGPWRCFQCNAVFTDRTAALAHFGDDSSEVPACSRGHRLIPLERERQLRLENEQQSEEIAAHERSDAEVLRISREALGTPDVHSPQEGAERMARKIAELRICLEPGKASGIVDAVFRIAREKCGRTGYEAHHALTDITRALDSQAVEITALREALEKAPHADDCEHETRFIHVEPCPFWTKKYCLVDDECLHGLAMGERCAKCEEATGTPSATQVTFAEGAERCHPAPCNCWKSRISAPQPLQNAQELHPDTE